MYMYHSKYYSQPQTTKNYCRNPLDRHSRKQPALPKTTFKADLDGAIFAYDYCARLAYVMIFDHLHAHSFHLQYPQCLIRMSWV